MTDDRGTGEIFRALGRIEAGVAEIKERGEGRDRNVADLTERVRQNRHEVNNNVQRAQNAIEQLGQRIAGVGDQVDGLHASLGSLDARVQALETPVRRAMQARQSRRRMWVKIVSVSSAVGVLMWAVFEPLYKVGMELLAKRWLGGG